MDIPCPRCAEPWDIDSLHDQAAEDGTTFSAVRRDFASRGCEAMGTTHNAATLGSDEADMAAVLFDLLGDDVDGIASMAEDAGLFG